MESVHAKQSSDAGAAAPRDTSLPIAQPRGGDPGPDFLFQLLEDQQQLTAVEEFAKVHEAGPPDQAAYYSKLLPATPPAEGQQYAFEVDLDRCSGCKACVTACHSLNGLDEKETWRDVGLLVGGSSSQPVMQHVTTACHHCLEPGCMIACPVEAYEKDPITGIVKHLDDQCFGCQYCTLACPYDVPKYHAGKGIVRKCDMCSDRLAVGEAPACVQACPHEAISIKVVDRQQVIEDAETDYFLPASPDPQITLPTTNYKTARVFPRNTLPADYYSVNPQHPHWPLIIMLVLTQLSVGAFLVGMGLEQLIDETLAVPFRRLHASSALAFGLLALAASTLHLGRPQYAFRAVIGLRHSWLSREIVVFGAFAGSAMLYAALCWLSPNSVLLEWIGWSVGLTGVAGIFCSVMIYVFTQREFWNFGATAAKFTLTSILLGIATTLLSLILFARFFNTPETHRLAAVAGPVLIKSLLVVFAAKLSLELWQFRSLFSRRQSPLKRSAKLLIGPLAGFTFARFACGVIGGLFMPLIVWNALAADEWGGPVMMLSIHFLFITLLIGEILERYQFFAACAAPRMPGRLN